MRRAMTILAEQGLIARSGPRGWVLQASESRSRSEGAIAVLSHWPHETTLTSHLGIEPAVERAALAALHARERDALHPYLNSGFDPALIQRLKANGVAGVLASVGMCSSPEGAAFLRRFREAGVAVVGQGGDANAADFDRVVGNHAAGTALLVRHLAGRGSRRLLRAWQGENKPWWLHERDLGYIATVRELGLPEIPDLMLDEPLIRSKAPDPENFRRRTRHAAGWLVDRLDGIDGVLAVTDWSAVVLAGALRLLGRNIPVVGYDNVWNTAWELELAPQALAATIEKRNDRVGETMVDMLLARLAGSAGPEPQCRTVTPELVVLEG